MGLRTSAQYLDGLRDGREVYYQGRRVEDVTTHPEIGIAARHAAIDFELAENPEFRDLTVHREGSETYSRYYHLPRDANDLLARTRLIEAGTTLGATLVILIKEIGTDALFALYRVLARAKYQEGLERLDAFYRRCRDQDLALAVAQTDTKGDRSKRPSEQPDPDMYVRVVEERPDGIVVRGAKVHTSCAPYVDEMIVLPSRSMGPGDEPWSVAFAVPMATRGLRMYASDFLHGTEDPFTRPISTKHKMVETLTVFDDVFVPWERVFFHGRPDLAGAAALTFVEYHRFTAVSYKLPLLDALIGASIAIAQANGIERAGHVRDKLTWLAGYVETVRGLIELAALRCGVDEGLAFPHVFSTNMAKWTFARDFHRAIEIAQDLAGGLLVTGPSGADWNAPEIRPVLQKYLRGAWPADQRLAMLNLISELTVRLYGGYQAILTVHAEGSLEAEKLAMLRAYNPKRAYRLAMRLAGLDPDKAGAASK
ncbi:MAG TPA: 4-hydroxyphenylacetate 3-hydroxylase N-terminal domain-containing protein [Patescibacteria group bacterium]|nr:4-hydroxyphenylacetate 3-hydroxylase N-terminal domain-containing protein [Patescibacteria group bacterium]